MEANILLDAPLDGPLVVVLDNDDDDDDDDDDDLDLTFTPQSEQINVLRETSTSGNKKFE